MINITESAKSHIKNQLSSVGKDILLFGVKGGGCAGFEYYWQPVDSSELAENEELVDLGEGKTLALDVMSLMYVMGSTIDYKQEFMGSMLVVENPLAQSSCGCGVSVNITPQEPENPFDN